MALLCETIAKEQQYVVYVHWFINPRRACAARVTALGLSFCLSVRLSGTPYSGTTRNKAAKKRYQRVQCHTGLIFRKSTAFKSYGLKTKPTSQYANKHGLPRPDSARFEHGGDSRSNTKGEYVVLVCQKHYLRYLARVFTVEKLVAAYLYRMRISRVRACTCTPTNLRMRNATYWCRGDYTHTQTMLDTAEQWQFFTC